MDVCLMLKVDLYFVYGCVYTLNFIT